jgi:P2 family phage major capsid protein
MRNETRALFNAYRDQIARLNGVTDAATKFAATPSVQQTLETKMQESSAFLQKINIIGVNELKGEKVGIGVTGPIASRTDTSGAGSRTPRDVSALSTNDYECKQTNYDTYIRYALLDAWAKFPDFQTRLRDVIIKRQALDRICIGWNGTSAAATTDLGTNALLQDVNIGWLQQYRTNAAARVMDEVVADSSAVKVGATGDYKNLDALVMDAKSSLIDDWYQEDPGLVCILGRDLLQDKYFPLVDKDQGSQDALATQLIISQKRVGGLQAVSVPFMPADALMITALDNLSIYFQDGSRRRYIKDTPEKDRVENYESSNDAFVVEDYGRGCVVENITLV